LNSHHDPNLDIRELSKFDTSYTYDFDISIKIGSAIPLVSISLSCTNNLPGIDLLPIIDHLPQEETITIVDKLSNLRVLMILSFVTHVLVQHVLR